MALGGTEIIVIACAAVFIFGAPRVIEWARALGKAKKAYSESYNEELSK